MAGGWSLGENAANLQTYGAVTASTTLTALTTGATNTKGSYVQLVASTTADSKTVRVLVGGVAPTGTALSIDIAVGAAASEKIIIPDFVQQTNSLSEGRFPLSIAAGSRIAARAQSTSSADTARVAVIVSDDAWGFEASGTVVDCLGFSSGTSKGTAVDAGASANTKGSYTQITAATTSDYIGLVIYGANPGVSASTFFLVDIAIGAAGSEKIILSNVFIRHSSWGATIPSPIPYLDIPIPTGSRLAIRLQSSSTTATTRTILFTVYGVRA